MSVDQYQFQMMYRQEHMSRADRLEADERAGRIAQGLFGLGQALARAVRRREVSSSGGATMQLRRSA